MTDLSRYNPITKTYTGTSGNDEININDIVQVYPGETGYVVNAGPGNDVIATLIVDQPRFDFINGEDGNDTMAVSTFGVTGGLVWLSGGRGTDSALLVNPILFPEFRVGNESIEFDLESASGSLLVRVFLTTELITIKFDDYPDPLLFLTEDIFRGRIREVTFAEVFDRAYLDNADWHLKGLDTFDLALDGGLGTTGAITSSIAGVFREGVTLRAADVVGDPDGLPTNPSYAYQWYRNGVAIAGATASTYFVPARGSGTYSVGVTYTDLIDYRETVFSPDQFVAAINNGNGSAGAMSSSIAGVFREGVTLSAPAVFGDPDGMPANPNYSYQWFRNESAIAGATGKNYTVPNGRTGIYRVAVTYTDQQGFRATVSSPNQMVGKILSGTSGADNLIGTIGSDLITGLAGADRLTGGGAADTFRYNALTETRLSSYDRITDFAIGSDNIDAPTAIRPPNISVLGRATALTQKGINQLFVNSPFRANSAATFTLGSGPSTRTFIALNDRFLGFDASRDAFIEITGFSGTLSRIVIN